MRFFRRFYPNSASVFLPNAGPFALGLDSIPTGPNVNTLSDLTVSTNTSIPTSRRKTMLKYNRLTINASRTWTVQAADMCLFVWANEIVINGTINTSGTDGNSANSNNGADGGYGASGGGGGGGGIQCGGCSSTAGGGGTGGFGVNGESGGDSSADCSPYASGGTGGQGVGDANLVSGDGYDYAGLLLLNIAGSGQPYGYGGQGANGDGGGGGGAGGGSGGTQVYVCNSIRAGAAGILRSRGGNPGLDADSDLFASPGDDGSIAILTRHYDGSLNGKVQVLGSQSNGISKIFQITGQGASTTFTSKLFSQTW